MGSDQKLEATIDKILTKYESELLGKLKQAHDEHTVQLAGAGPSLEEEYDRILDDARKEAEKISKQIIGSSDLQARNKHLLLIQEHMAKVFEEAVSRIGSADRGGDYSKLITILLKESIGALGTPDVIVSTTAADRDAVNAALSGFPGAELSPEPIECLGGVRVRSKDGAMSYDNTIDSRLERMTPMIRKEIATRFGSGE